MCFGESTHTKQGLGKVEDEWTRDWERSTARDESGARSQWLRGLIPHQNMFAQDGTRNLKHGDAAAVNQMWADGGK